MTLNENASITLSDELTLQIERIVEAREDVGDIIEAAGHSVELLLESLPGGELVELLRSVRDDLAAHRLDRESSRLRDLYDHAYIIIKYGRLSWEDRELAEEYLKEISQHFGMTFDDGATPDDADTMTKSVVLSTLFSGSDVVRLGYYSLLELIATDGMCDVYVAYDERLDRRVAIKILRPDLSAGHSVVRQRLLREAQIMARIAHPNIVRVYDFGEIDGHIFIVEEYVAGIDLGRWSSDGLGRHWEAVLEKFLAAGRGLAALHEAGFMHRDFKPKNVLIDHEGRTFLIDFGLGRAVDTKAPAKEALFGSDAGHELGPLSDITARGQVLGTPAYMSPEQWRAEELDPRSDQFSFCVALYEALYGDRPFHGESLTSLRERVLGGDISPPPRHSKVPRQIWRVLSRGLAPDRSARFPTMHELLVALERAAERMHQRRYQWAAAASFLAAGASLVSGTMFVQASSSYDVLLEALALIAAALGGISFGKALQTRSDLSAPKSSTLKPTEEDKPTT